MYVAVFFLIFSPHHFWFLMGIFLENAFSKLVQDGTEKIMKQAARVMSNKLELYFLTNCSSFLLAQPLEPLCSTGSPLIVRFLGPRKNVLMEIRTIRGVFMI